MQEKKEEDRRKYVLLMVGLNLKIKVLQNVLL